MSLVDPSSFRPGIHSGLCRSTLHGKDSLAIRATPERHLETALRPPLAGWPGLHDATVSYW